MSEGYCAVELPSLDTKELLENDIIISLGGYIAEKMIFGEDKLSNGTYEDFKRATNVALEMSKTYGMTGIPMLVGQKNLNTNTTWVSHRVDEEDLKAEHIIKACEQKCEKILKENKYLLLKIGEYLSVNSRMNSKKIKQFIDEFGKKVELKDRNNYHTFKASIKNEIEKIESNSAIPKINVNKLL